MNARPPRFDVIQLAIRPPQEAHHVVGSFQLREPHGESDFSPSRLDLDLAKLLAAGLHGGIRQGAHELVATIAKDKVLAAKSALERGGQTAQELVADFMAAAVVSLLEAVD